MWWRRSTRVPMTTWSNPLGRNSLTPESGPSCDAEHLSRKEFDLLLALAERAGTVVSKRELLAEVWRQPYGGGGGERTVDVHLSWLRRKLGETADEPRYLHSVWGVGVRLAPPDEA
jgi:DNA-binding response OmpR family regulator